MTPEQERKLNEVYEFIQLLKNSASIPYEVDGAFRDRLASQFVATKEVFTALALAPLGAITAPTGGATVDGAARSAINAIIGTLENVKIVDPN